MFLLDFARVFEIEVDGIVELFRMSGLFGHPLNAAIGIQNDARLVPKKGEPGNREILPDRLENHGLWVQRLAVSVWCRLPVACNDIL